MVETEEVEACGPMVAERLEAPAEVLEGCPGVVEDDVCEAGAAPRLEDVRGLDVCPPLAEVPDGRPRFWAEGVETEVASAVPAAEVPAEDPPVAVEEPGWKTAPEPAGREVAGEKVVPNA